MRALLMLGPSDHVLLAGSYNSELATVSSASCEKPPVTRTLPLLSSVAVCEYRVVLIGEAADHVLLAGSYNSAELGSPQQPPATRTLPLLNSVAVWRYRCTLMLGAADHVLVAGSYSCALAVASKPVWPPV